VLAPRQEVHRGEPKLARRHGRMFFLRNQPAPAD